MQIKKEHLNTLNQEAKNMLGVWSADILEIWTEVYSLSLAQLVAQSSEDADELLRLRNDCKHQLTAMSEGNQPIKVRIKAASMLGQVAELDALGDSKTYLNFFQGKLHNLCQDLHWEIRREMCTHLMDISLYIGNDESEKIVLKEIIELLEDEEGEVVTEAITQYQKHLNQVFSPEYRQSQEAVTLFMKAADQAIDSDVTLVDLGNFLKRMCKMLISFDQPNNAGIQ